MSNNHDDFFTADDAYGEKCNSVTSILKSEYILPLFGAISTLCYIYIFYMYFILNSPLLKRHPTSKCHNIFYIL